MHERFRPGQRLYTVLDSDRAGKLAEVVIASRSGKLLDLEYRSGPLLGEQFTARVDRTATHRTGNESSTSEVASTLWDDSYHSEVKRDGFFRADDDPISWDDDAWHV